MTSTNRPSPEKVMTGVDFENMAAGMHAGKRWEDWTEEEKAANLAHREQVRQACVAEYSSSPLWQQRAAKDPEYWNTFSVGRHNL